jgi:hypothetical protein
MADKEADDPVLLRFRNMSRPARVVYARPRTFFSVAIGIAAFFLLPDSLRLVTRLLMSWDIFIVLCCSSTPWCCVAGYRISSATRCCRTMAAS